MRMKKLLSLLLLMFLPMMASAETVQIDGIYYTLIPKGNVAHVTSGSTQYTGSVVIPSTVVYNDVTYNVDAIEDNAFKSCIGLTSVSVPGSVTKIGQWAFAYCTALTTATLADGVTKLDEHAFHACEALTAIDIPNSVTEIGNIAFSGCKALTSAKLSDNITVIRQSTFQNCTSLTTIDIPANVKEIELGVFNGCTALTTVNIPEGVTTLGNQLFKGCTSLASITLPNSVTTMGNGLFNGCTALASVTLPNSLTEINYDTFKDCTSLTTMDIPASVTTLGEFAFNGCTGLTSMQLHEGLTKMESGVFYECANLATINLPSTLTSIGGKAFMKCTSLTAVNLPEGLTEIASECFKGCTALTAITIPNSVTTIESYAFQNCSAATTLTIGSGTKQIWNYAFQGCSSLQEVTIPDNVIETGNQIFRECTGMTKLTIGTGLKQVSQGSFRECSSLTEVTIPDQVEIVSIEAFYKCAKLETVTLGRNLESISALTFASCDNLKDVFCSATTPPSAYDKSVESQYTFKDSYVEYATLHVPAASINAYKETAPWSDFGEIIALPNSEYKLTYLVDGEVYKTYYLKEGDAITPEPAPIKEGYNFSGWSEIPPTMPAHDVEVTGTFTIAKYKLTYMVDGEVYKSYELEFEQYIPYEPEPTKQGYVFSGWSEIPQYMPAHDVTITGTFTANKYQLVYYVDGVEHKRYELEYGATITPEPAPEKEGYTFSGWSEIPPTMPAHDVTVTGSFTINKYTITYMIDNELYTTEKVNYGAAITPPTPPARQGYEFAWGDYPETMPAHDITIYGTYTSGIQTIMADDENTRIYSIDGKLLSEPQKGLIIIRMSNGVTKKVVVK